MYKFLFLFFSLFSSFACADLQKVTLSLQKAMPGAKFDFIEEVKQDGLTDLFMVGVDGNVFYISGNGKYIFKGTLFDINKRLDFAYKKKKEVRLKEISKVNKSEKITYKSENEKYVINVFTDVDCGYCRKLHLQMQGYLDNGITVNYLFFPRAGIGSDSYNKSVSVWCNKDRKKAITDVKSGIDIASATCDNPINAHFELGNNLGVKGTPFIIDSKGRSFPGYLPPDKMLLKLQTVM